VRAARWLIPAAVLAASPFLQGAGCRAHYSARLRGTVAIDRSIQPAPGPGELVVLFRTHRDEQPACSTDWAPCLRAQADWSRVRRCGVEGKEALQGYVVRAAGQGYSFEACTGYIGVDYRADVAAFVDGDRDGVLDRGEAYGVWPGGPLTREREPELLPLTIAIDRRMP